jgi:hypothetical protein
MLTAKGPCVGACRNSETPTGYVSAFPLGTAAKTAQGQVTCEFEPKVSPQGQSKGELMTAVNKPWTCAASLKSQASRRNHYVLQRALPGWRDAHATMPVSTVRLVGLSTRAAQGSPGTSAQARLHSRRHSAAARPVAGWHDATKRMKYLQVRCPRCLAVTFVNIVKFAW